MEAMKFRNKVVEVEAMYFDGTEASLHAISRWITDGQYAYDTFENYDGGDVDYVVIENPGYDVKLFAGDWLIKGVGGNFLPLGAELFFKAYEPV